MHCSSALQLDYRFPSSVPVSEALKDLLRRVFVSTREARVGLAGLAAHPWVTDDGSLPPIATVPAAAGGPPQGWASAAQREPHACFCLMWVVASGRVRQRLTASD
jgi:hypothetical protein